MVKETVSARLLTPSEMMTWNWYPPATLVVAVVLAAEAAPLLLKETLAPAGAERTLQV